MQILSKSYWKNNLLTNLDLLFFILLTFPLLLKIALLFFVNLQGTSFSPDSWAYFDISQNIFTDFYRVSYIRQFQYFTDYSISFPPLYPLLIALFNKIWNVGIYAGYIINFVILLLTFAISAILSKKITSFYTPSIFMILALLSSTDYLNELLLARSIPLSILLTLLTVFIVIQKNLTHRKIVVIGILTGLLSLNRFDFFIPGLFFGLVLVSFKINEKFRKIALYYASHLLTLSPWIAYSYMHFKKFYISDNLRTVFLAFNNFPLDYFPDPQKLLTILNSPVKWIADRVVLTALLTFISFVRMIYFFPFVQQLIWVNLLLFFTYCVSRRNIKKFNIPKTDLHIINVLLLLLPIFLIQLITISFMGFLEVRYTLIFQLYVVIVLMSTAFIMLKKIMNKIHIQILVFLCVLLTMCNFLLPTLSDDINMFIGQKKSFNENNVTPNSYYSQIINTVQMDSSKPTILVHGRGSNAVYPAQFGAISRIKTLETPSNINEYILVALIEKYNIGYVHTSCKYWINTLYSEFNIHNTGVRNLYKISDLKNKNSLDKIPYSIKPDTNYKDCIY